MKKRRLKGHITHKTEMHEVYLTSHFRISLNDKVWLGKFFIVNFFLFFVFKWRLKLSVFSTPKLTTEIFARYIPLTVNLISALSCQIAFLQRLLLERFCSQSFPASFTTTHYFPANQTS